MRNFALLFAFGSCWLMMFQTAVFAYDPDLLTTLKQKVSRVGWDHHGPVTDLSDEVCPLIDASVMNALRMDFPAEVKGFEMSGTTGFPPRTTHWGVLGEWLDSTSRNTMFIHVNDAGYCWALVNRLWQEVPNPELAAAERAEAQRQAGKVFRIELAGQPSQIAQCAVETFDTLGSRASLKESMEQVEVRSLDSNGVQLWTATLQPSRMLRRWSSVLVQFASDEAKRDFEDVSVAVFEDCQSGADGPVRSEGEAL